MEAAVARAKKDAGGAPRRPGRAERTKPKGRRDLLASKLPRLVVEIRDEQLEAKGCRRIGFDDSAQLMFRRGGFVVLVRRVARYEVVKGGTTTALTELAAPLSSFEIPAELASPPDRARLAAWERSPARGTRRAAAARAAVTNRPRFRCAEISFGPSCCNRV